MQSNKKLTSSGKQKEKDSKCGIRIGLLAVCAVVLTTGGLLAKYITSNQKQAEMESAQFHISSNYLLEEEKAAEYTVTNWGDGFDILLYNYEKENIAQVSQVDMAYKVTAENALVNVSTQQGASLIQNDGIYSFKAETMMTYHMLHVTPNANVVKGDKITITVETTSPYKKILTAVFNIQNNSKPDYMVADQNDGTILITVKTNDYQDSMTVTWDAGKYSPDNTNVLMTSWKDEESNGTFKVECNSTYELLFFKNTDDAYTQTQGTGTEINLD